MQGWKAVGQLSVSSGQEINCYGGSFFRHTASGMDLPARHCAVSDSGLEVDAEIKKCCRVGRLWAGCACPVDLR